MPHGPCLVRWVAVAASRKAVIPSEYAGAARDLLLTHAECASTLRHMEVRLKPETESILNELSSKSGRPADDIVEDAMAAYLAEVSSLRGCLDSRYDNLKSGRVTPIGGERFFDDLRRREASLPKPRSSK